MQRPFAFETGAFPGGRDVNRAVSMGLVLLLHVLVLAVVLYERGRTHAAIEPREMILTFLPRPRAPTVPLKPSRAARKPETAAPAFPDYRNVLPAQPDLTALGRTLFGCDPDHLDALSPQQKSHCIAYRDAVASRTDHAGLDMPSRAAAAALWAESIARRNTPAKVDCSTVQTQAIGAQQVTTMIADIPCVLRHLAARRSLVN